MFGEVRLQSKGLSTLAAGVRLVAGVRLCVCSQVALVGKGLVALVALERLLTSVGSDVALEQPRPGEVLATEGAAAASGGGDVGPDVHGQGGGAAELFHAVVTSLGSLRLGLLWGAEALHHAHLGSRVLRLRAPASSGQVQGLRLDLIGDGGGGAGRRP